MDMETISVMDTMNNLDLLRSSITEAASGYITDEALLHHLQRGHGSQIAAAGTGL